MNKARVGEPARGIFQLNQHLFLLRRNKFIESIVRITRNVMNGIINYQFSITNQLSMF